MEEDLAQNPNAFLFIKYENDKEFKKFDQRIKSFTIGTPAKPSKALPYSKYTYKKLGLTLLKGVFEWELLFTRTPKILTIQGGRKDLECDKFIREACKNVEIKYKGTWPDAFFIFGFQRHTKPSGRYRDIDSEIFTQSKFDFKQFFDCSVDSANRMIGSVTKFDLKFSSDDEPIPFILHEDELVKKDTGQKIYVENLKIEQLQSGEFIKPVLQDENTEDLPAQKISLFGNKLEDVDPKIYLNIEINKNEKFKSKIPFNKQLEGLYRTMEGRTNPYFVSSFNISICLFVKLHEIAPVLFLFSYKNKDAYPGGAYPEFTFEQFKERVRLALDLGFHAIGFSSSDFLLHPEKDQKQIEALLAELRVKKSLVVMIYDDFPEKNNESESISSSYSLI